MFDFGEGAVGLQGDDAGHYRFFAKGNPFARGDGLANAIITKVRHPFIFEVAQHFEDGVTILGFDKPGLQANDHSLNRLVSAEAKTTANNAAAIRLD